MSACFVPLDEHANAHAATFNADRAAGFVNPWGNSFPAEEVPFGRTLICNGVPFQLGSKRAAEPDHVECLRLELATEASIATRTIGLLGFSELGNQTLELGIVGRFKERRHATLVVPYWLNVPRDAAGPAVWQATHLHYAAGYELDRLVPSLHAVILRLPSPFHAVSIEFEANPLVHIMALTLLDREVQHA